MALIIKVRILAPQLPLALAFLLFAALPGSGCTPPNADCRRDEDCISKSYCDLELGICTALHDDICRPLCLDHEQCVGGRCAPRYQAIAFRAPLETQVSQGARVAVELILGPDRSPQDPPQLPLEVQAGGAVVTGNLFPSASPSQFEGPLPAVPPGPVRVTVGYPEAGLSSIALPLEVLP